MRYSILGFQQEKLIGYDLSMNEVLILDYIYNAQASTRMEHKIENGLTYTWINHDKLMEDLPILNIKEDRLKQLIKRLVELGLLQRVIVRDIFDGSKAYYGITETCEDMRYYDQHDERGIKNYTSRGVKNYTSDNKLIDKNKKNISKDILQDVVTSEDNLTKLNNKLKSKGKNLFQKCIDLINDFTNDEDLRHDLTECFKLFSENSREVGRPFYANNFKGKLNTLSKLSTNTEIQSKIVKQTLDNGWQNFYELKDNTTKKKSSSRYTSNEPTDMGYVVDRADRRNSISGEKF